MPSSTATSVLVDTTDISKELRKLEIRTKGEHDIGSYKSPFYASRVLGEDGVLILKPEEREGIIYKEWEPVWNTADRFPPYELFDFRDHGLDADPNFKNLFPTAKKGQIVNEDLTPKFGSEVRGVQLSELTDAGKDELALFVAQRGVVVFRDQDLADKGVEFNSKFGSYFGPLHVHQASGAPRDHPEIHLVYRSSEVSPKDTYLKTHTSTIAWHSDVSFEKQPPSITFLGLLQAPSSGGDTVFVDTEEAYNRLSPEFQKIVEGLSAVHSSVEQAEGSLKTGGILRRDPVKSIHPLVRKQPVTGKKALYINEQFTRDIVGLKVEESRALLQFLYTHLSYSIDLHVRAKWAPGTIVVWDNRRTGHSAIFDWDSEERRHLYRLTPRAEVPSLY